MRPSERFIAHYASPYYDPIKAHQYYMENRQLAPQQPAKPEEPPKPTTAAAPEPAKKGRGGGAGSRGGTGKAAAQARAQQAQANRQALNNSLTQLKERHTTEQAQAQQAHEAALAKIQERGAALQKTVRDKLQKFADELLNRKFDPTTVQKPQLNEIPKGASPQMRAFLEAQNRQFLSRYQQQLTSAENAFNANKSLTLNNAKSDTQAELQKVAGDLRAAISTARTAYNASRQKSNEQYKQLTEAERQKYKTQR